VLVPAARSPFKGVRPTADEHRLTMLRLAVRATERTAIWTDEIDRARAGEPSYWIVTLRRARAARPGAKLWFLIGSDQAADFHRWRDARAILDLATPIVMPRAPITTPESLAASMRDVGAWTVEEIARWRVALAPLTPVESSATQARAILRSRGPDDPALRDLLDPGVLEYIRAHELYAVV
jgi:nicotinate-nucleotide adenylyltransferase